MHYRPRASLRDLKAGSQNAQRVKSPLIEEGLCPQYLEVGIGPDAEVFTKAQIMSSVGTGAAVGLHPVSKWNNPEPEIVLAVDSEGRVKGAALGNDVNLPMSKGARPCCSQGQGQQRVPRHRSLCPSVR